VRQRPPHRRNSEAALTLDGTHQIQLDIDRLPTRNLGRDDRIISSHSVEARYPYLSLTFIDYVSSLPIETKMDFRLAEPRSDGDVALGDKMLLRLAARRLGLEQAAYRKKRAMQFGARSAKMEIEDRRPGGARKGWGAEALGQPLRET
jgi:asparagine synthetase B (glutamine-hydrolysing)